MCAVSSVPQVPASHDRTEKRKEMGVIWSLCWGDLAPSTAVRHSRPHVCSSVLAFAAGPPPHSLPARLILKYQSRYSSSASSRYERQSKQVREMPKVPIFG